MLLQLIKDRHTVKKVSAYTDITTLLATITPLVWTMDVLSKLKKGLTEYLVQEPCLVQYFSNSVFIYFFFKLLKGLCFGSFYNFSSGR